MGYVALLIAVALGALIVYYQTEKPVKDDRVTADVEANLIIDALDDANTAKSQLEGRTLSD